jgi:hypothetical protein
MMATRESKSALLKSRIEQMELRLKELDLLTQEARESMAQIRKQIGEVVAPLIPSIFSAPLAPRPPVVCRPAPTLPPKIKVVKISKKSGRPRVFTPDVCAQIPTLLEEGLNREQIAERIGSTLGSLVATCSKKGISLRAKGRRGREIQVVYEEAV